LALDEMRTAEAGLLNAVTAAQEESAAARLRRVAAHARRCREDLVTHCARHGCPVPVPGVQPGGILRRDAGAGASWSGYLAA
jgi:hypothetical protein